jgi:hypothetical protein
MAEFAGNNPDPCEPLAGRFPMYDNAFLQSIDKAMQILPKARIQTATEWLNLINKEGERVKPIRLRNTEDLGQKLTRLVSETNEYVLNSQPRDAARKPFRGVPRPDGETKASPDWADEFNRETSETQKPRSKKEAVAADDVERVLSRPGLIDEPVKKRKRSIFRFFGRS